MYCIRDLLVFGPVVLARCALRDASWGLILTSALLLYCVMRLLADVTGLETAVSDRRADRSALSAARTATPAPPPRPPKKPQ